MVTGMVKYIVATYVYQPGLSLIKRQCSISYVCINICDIISNYDTVEYSLVVTYKVHSLD